VILTFASVVSACHNTYIINKRLTEQAEPRKVSMLCAIHGKEMKMNARGFYCSTPKTKSADGTKVLEWCDWKPGIEQTSKPLSPMQNTQTTEEGGPDWDAIRSEKNRFIARQVAYKGAIEMVVAGMITPDAVWRTVDMHTEKLLQEQQSEPTRPIESFPEAPDIQIGVDTPF
jgi:hypothetical protein